MNDHDLIEGRLGQDEGPTLDFKSSPVRLDNDFFKAAFIKDIICMANTPRQGSSYVVIGVACKPDGSKEVIGTNEHPDDANLQTLVGGRVRPIPLFHYRTISYQGKTLGLLEIFPRRGGPFRPIWGYKDMLRQGIVYFRRGSSNEEAEAEDLREIAKWMSAPDQAEKTEERVESRKASIPIGGTSLTLPSFFPSISSVKANLKPVEYLRVITSVDHPLFLISAYDIHNCRNKHDLKRIEVMLRDSVRNQKAVILDSGNYESFWQKDKTWKIRDFWKCLESYDYGFAFYFDKREQQLLWKSAQRIINEVERGVLRDQEKTYKGSIIPIIHAPTDLFPDVACGLADRLAPVMIAMPERELGQGIIERAETIWKIRKALNETGQYYPLHLLGTGNPLSILLYALCGADSFDGVEWFQATVDHDRGRLYHFQQREFFGQQSEFCSKPELPYVQATLAHNLLFYRKWMERIQTSLFSGTIAELVQAYLPDAFLKTLEERLPEVLH